MKVKKKVLITTSREPSPRTRSFVKDLTSLAPWLVRLNRGKMTFQELVEEALAENSETLAVIGEMRGNPSIIRLYDLSQASASKKILHTYTIFLKGVALSREAGHHGIEAEKIREIIVDSIPEASEETRALILALHQLFQTGLTLPPEGKYIKISINSSLKIIKFKQLPGNLNMGPIIKYHKITSPRRTLELGEEIESK
ncbi:MAG: hypothetical protein QW039_06075 [Fervidicoccaceae archaeon]